MEHLSEYDYQLPPELIAVRPLPVRSQSRLLVLQKNENKARHDCFESIVKYLNQGDALVINNTFVIPARFFVYKKSGGKIEVLLSRSLGNNNWLVLCKSRKTLAPGLKLYLFNDSSNQSENYIEVIEKSVDELGAYAVHASVDLKEHAKSFGSIPLPPYLNRAADDADLHGYQTIYAKPQLDGAVAAPTAGFHFEHDLLQLLRSRGIRIVETTLHVGPGTFLPIRTEDISQHVMHKEYYELNDEAATTLNEVKKAGGRIVAVGTTSVRVLEQVMTNARAQGQSLFKAEQGLTQLYIRPGYNFVAVDALITNFHLPKSSLFVLISALLGKNLAKQVYQEAIENRYRFYSYGDACFFEVRQGP